MGAAVLLAIGDGALCAHDDAMVLAGVEKLRFGAGPVGATTTMGGGVWLPWTAELRQAVVDNGDSVRFRRSL